MNCPRCSKDTHGGYAHTCTPTEGWRKMESEIAELKRQLEEANGRVEDRADETRVERYFVNHWHTKALESQAREARLREALKYYRVNGHHEQSYNLACSALALPHDDTALKEYLAAVITQFVGEFKRHVGGDGEFWLHELEDYVDNLKEKEKHDV